MKKILKLYSYSYSHTFVFAFSQDFHREVGILFSFFLVELSGILRLGPQVIVVERWPFFFLLAQYILYCGRWLYVTHNLVSWQQGSTY